MNLLIFGWSFSTGSAIGLMQIPADQENTADDLVFINRSAFDDHIAAGHACPKCASFNKNYSVPHGVEVTARIVVGSDDRRECAPNSVRYTKEGSDGRIIAWYQCANGLHHHDQRHQVKRFASSCCDAQQLAFYRAYLYKKGVRINLNM